MPRGRGARRGNRGARTRGAGRDEDANRRGAARGENENRRGAGRGGNVNRRAAGLGQNEDRPGAARPAGPRLRGRSRSPLRQRPAPRDSSPPTLHRRTPDSSEPSSDEEQPNEQQQQPQPHPPPEDSIQTRLDSINARLDSFIPLLSNAPAQPLIALPGQSVPSAALGAPPASEVAATEQIQQRIVQGAMPGEIQPQTKFLGSTIDNDLRVKIKQAAFIDLPLLKKSSYESKEGSTTKLKQPKNFEEWLELFLIFATIRTTYFPQDAPHLFTYITPIKDLSRKQQGLVWRDYDVEFRRLKSVDSTLSWLKIDTDVLFTIPTHPDQPPPTQSQSKLNPPPPRQPFPASGGPPPTDACLPFYFGGWCSTIRSCTNKHLCANCGNKGHSFHNCYALKKSSRSTSIATSD